jgi:uncharacterized protein (DUF427 family)
MLRAMWKDVVLAQSERCEIIENNYYFPPESLNRQYFQDSSESTVCGWKGVASYFHVKVGEHMNKNAAWYYATPKPAAQNITRYVAFGKDVTVTDA